MPLKYLTRSNTYRSADRRPFWFARENPSFWFYSQMAMVVLQGSHLAKHGVYHRNRWIQSSLDIVRAIESIGGRFDIRNINGHRHVPSPVVFVANHMSVLETFVLPCLIQPVRDVTFVVKESLMTYPFFRHVMNSRDPIVVGRSNPRQDLKTVLEEGKQRLAAGVSVVIFPQTTRSSVFDPARFNTLGVKLASRSNVPAIPIAVKTDAWGNGRWLKDFGRIDPKRTVHICFGDPIPIGRTGKSAHHAIIEFISEKMIRWGVPVVS